MRVPRGLPGLPEWVLRVPKALRALLAVQALRVPQGLMAALGLPGLLVRLVVRVLRDLPAPD